MTPNFPLFLFFAFLILSPQQTNQFAPSSYKTLISLTDALLNRVAFARETRDDFEGAERARELAEKFRHLTEGSGVWNIGWDFAWNYATRRGRSTDEIKQSGIRLFEALKVLLELDSGSDRVSWVIKNNEWVTQLTNSWFKSLLAVFNRKGNLHEMILIFHRELVEGGMLKDIMEVGARDLDSLIRYMKTVFSPDENYGYDEL